MAPGHDRPASVVDPRHGRSDLGRAPDGGCQPWLPQRRRQHPGQNAQIARDALVAIPATQWTTAQRALLDGFTNVEFVQSEGSYGLHNWDYSREIVNKAMEQAKIAQTGVVVKLPWVVTFKMSKTTVKSGTAITFSGTVRTSKGVAGAGIVKYQKRTRVPGRGGDQQQARLVGQLLLQAHGHQKGTSYVRAMTPGDPPTSRGSARPTSSWWSTKTVLTRVPRTRARRREGRPPILGAALRDS